MINILHDTISSKTVLQGTQLVKKYNKYGKEYKTVTETLENTRGDFLGKKLTTESDQDCTAIITKILDKGNNELVVRIRNIYKGYQGEFYRYITKQYTLRNSQTSKNFYHDQSLIHRIYREKDGKIIKVGQYTELIKNFGNIRDYLSRNFLF